MTSRPADTNPASPLDELLSDALDAHAAGDANAARKAWSKIEALGPAAVASARRTQQSLQELRATRMPVDLTDRVMARLESNARSAPRSAPVVNHTARAPERPTPRRRLRLPRLSGTTIAALLGLATVSTLMLVARPTTPARFAAQPEPSPIVPRRATAPIDQVLPTPGVQDALPLETPRLTLGDTSRYDANHLTPLTPWGSSSRGALASTELPAPWWLASANHTALAPLLAKAPKDAAVLTPSQRAGQELMLLLEAHAQQLKQADEPIQRPR